MILIDDNGLVSRLSLNSSYQLINNTVRLFELDYMSDITASQDTINSSDYITLNSDNQQSLIDSLYIQLNSLANSVTSLSSELSIADSTNALLNDQINSLNATVYDLNDQIVTLEYYATYNNDQIAILNENIAILNATIANLNSANPQQDSINVLTSNTITFRAFIDNYYNAIGLITTGIVARIISNYRIAFSKGMVTVVGNGLWIADTANFTLQGLNIGLSNVDIHFWFKFDNANVPTDLLRISSSANSSYSDVRYRVTNSVPNISLTKSATTLGSGNIPSISDGNYHYLQFTVKNQIATVYFDGLAIITTTYVIDYGTNATLVVGYNSVYSGTARLYNSLELLVNGTARLYNSLELLVNGTANQITIPPTLA